MTKKAPLLPWQVACRGPQLAASRAPHRAPPCGAVEVAQAVDVTLQRGLRGRSSPLRMGAR